MSVLSVVVMAQQQFGQEGWAHPCPECGEYFKAGDVAVRINQGKHAYVHRVLSIHREHFDALLVDAPVTEAALDAEARAMHATVAETGLSPVEALFAGAA